jgi:hypothetical protein
MNIDRKWVTPLAAGAFLISAVTGVLIFFHADTGLIKAAHEWLSWALLSAVLLHAAANFAALKRHLKTRLGAGIVAAFALVLTASFFLSAGDRGEPPFMASVQALANAPIATLAQVAHKNPEQVRATLAAEGLAPTADTQTLAQLAGPNVGKRMRLLQKVLAPEKGQAG